MDGVNPGLLWVGGFVWISSVFVGYSLGRMKGLAGIGVILSLLFGVFGVIIIACLETADARLYRNIGLRWWGGPSAAIQLRELVWLKEEGLISNEEYQFSKQRLLPRHLRTRRIATRIRVEPIPTRIRTRIVAVLIGVVLLVISVATLMVFLGTRHRLPTDSAALFEYLKSEQWECRERGGGVSRCNVPGDPAYASVSVDGDDITFSYYAPSNDDHDPEVLFRWLKSDFHIPSSVWEKIETSLDTDDFSSEGVYSWRTADDGSLLLKIKGG